MCVFCFVFFSSSCSSVVVCLHPFCVFVCARAIYLRITPHNNPAGVANGRRAVLKSEMHLKLPMKRTIFDIGCDQGYGSERSPDDELPPILTIPYQVTEHQMRHQYAATNVPSAVAQQQQLPPPPPPSKHQVKWQDQVHESDFSFITDGKCSQSSMYIQLCVQTIGRSVFEMKLPYVRGVRHSPTLQPNVRVRALRWLKTAMSTLLHPPPLHYSAYPSTLRPIWPNQLLQIA